MHFVGMSRASLYQRREVRDPKKRLDPESLTKAQLVRIVKRAMENPEDFSLWLRRETSAMEGTGSFDREMRAQIENVFGDVDYETDASGLIASMREAVESGKELAVAIVALNEHGFATPIFGARSSHQRHQSFEGNKSIASTD
jgi:hypothetical protein